VKAHTVVSLMRRLPFTPQEDSWYSFLLEAVDPRTTVLLEEIGELKKIHKIGIQTHDCLACSIMPQPTMLQCAPIYRIILTILISNQNAESFVLKV
jgi:hypothetical protein